MERRRVLPGFARASWMAACLALALFIPAAARAGIANLTRISVGSDHACVVTAVGGVKCWGQASDGQLGDGLSGGLKWGRWIPVTPQGLANGVAAVSAGGQHTCALMTTGTVKCWGYNFRGQLGTGDRTSSPVPVDVPGLTGVAGIAAGGAFTCARMNGGGVKCWGDNFYGQLADGTSGSNTGSLVPKDIPSLAGVTEISTGSLHACARTAGGGAKCWGYNEYGQLGDGTKINRNLPVEVSGLASGVASVVAGNTTSCAVTTGGAAKCWGFNRYNEIGDGADPLVSANWYRTTPTDVTGLSSGVAGIAVGARHACARLSNGTAKCWGSGEFYGAVGDGTFAQRATPVDVTGLTGVSQLGGGTGHYCALVTGGKVRCWGKNEEGQAGGALARGPQPRPSVGVPEHDVATGISHNLLVNAKGELWAWGDNTAGKLGNGNTTGTTVPVRVTGLTNVVGAAAGMGHSLAVKADGTVWAWGLNSDGQLGIGATSPSSCVIPGESGPDPGGGFPCALAPVQVPGLEGVVAVSAGWRHSLALMKDGTVWRWGNDNRGGIGPASSVTSPEQVPGIGFGVRIAAGYMHSVALESSGIVFAWGRAERGELGRSTVTSTATPVNLANTESLYADDIAAGGGFTLARTDTYLRAWGSNAYGALGDAAVPTTDGFFNPGFRARPDDVPGMVDVAFMTAGFGFAAVRKLDGTVWTWGLNTRGQLGNGGAAPDLCGLSPSQPCVRTPVNVIARDGALRLAAGGAHALDVRPDGAINAFGDNLVGQHGNRGGNYKTGAFTQTIYDPDFTLTPGGAFGTPTGVGSGSTSGSLDADTVGGGLSFGALAVGASTAPVDVVLSNLSASDAIAISAVGTSPSTEFGIASNGCAGTLAGNASCTISLVFNPSQPGERNGTLTVTSNATNSQTISLALSGTGIDPRAASTVALAASAASTPAGAGVTFTATVNAGATTPTGTVAFKDGAATITGCAAVAVASGAAQCATNALAVGVHSITAEYSGDGSVQPSISAPLAHTVFTEFTLTVAKSGAGSGTVTSSPAGIACGGDCTQAYAEGTAVALTAVAASGSVFSGWSGECTGTGACNVTMDAAKSVTAAFGVAPANTFSLTVAKSGAGSGTVTSAPAGINCGSSCAFSFNTNTAVTLTATPASGSVFSGWSGACTGTGTCQVTMDAAKTVTATFAANTATPRLANISTRGPVFTGNDVMIGGFVIGGTSPKQVLVTARGPSLAPFGVTGVMANPTLQLLSGQTVIAANDDFGTAPNLAQISATGVAPTDPLESAILATLNPGAYTAIVSGAGGGTGVAIVEVFERDRPDAPLINISTRGQVQTVNNVMIGGFVIQGDAPQTVLITARGPSLAPFGIANPLANPSLQLFSGQTLIASNDDFGTAPNLAQIQATGVAPTNALESAILVTLNPGAYTAIVSGVGGGTGVGIVEVFAQ